MFFGHWQSWLNRTFRSFFRGKRQPIRNATSRRVRPSLELLEDRTVPTGIDGQLWYVTGLGLTPYSLRGHINSDGSNPVPGPSFAQTSGGVDGQNVVDIDADPAAGYYFVMDTGSDSFNHSTTDPTAVSLISYRISDNSQVDFVTIGDHTDLDLTQALAVDPYNHVIYVAMWGVDLAHSGIEKVTYDPLTGDLGPAGTFFVNGTSAGAVAVNDVRYISLDLPNHLIYFTANSNGYNVSPFSASNGVFVADLSAINPTATQLTSSTQFPPGAQTADPNDPHRFDNVDPNGYLGAVAVDAPDHLVYFLTHSIHPGTNDPQDALWYVTTNGGAGQTAQKVTGVTVTYAGENGGLSFDPQTRQLYISDQDQTASNSGHVTIAQLSVDGHSVVSTRTFSMAALTGVANPDQNDAVLGTAFFNLPVLTLSGTSTHATEQGGFVDLSASSTSTDVDGDHYASATVQITAGTFSTNETSVNDDHLSVNDGGTHKTSGTFTGIPGITISYDSATEKLTLTGYDTIAHYNTILAAVEYHTTGDNPTNYGNNPTRTISWTVSDGQPNIPFGAQNSASTTVTIDAANDAPVNHLPATLSINEDVQTAISGLSITDVDADPANQDITVTLSVAHGTLNVLTNVAGGIIGADITGGAQNSNSITITATQNQINATIAGSGLRYQGNLNFNTGFATETLHIVTSDNGHTDSAAFPGAQLDTDDLAITVNPVNDNPNLQPDTTTAVSYTENAAATALFATENVDTPLGDVDQSANYSGGSINLQVTAGLVSGDRIVLTGSRFTISAGNILDTANGNAIVGTIGVTNATSHVTVSALTSAATPSVVDALVQSFGFDSTSDNPGSGDRTVTLTFNDGGNTGGGGALTDNVLQTVHVTPVNDAPVATITPTSYNASAQIALTLKGTGLAVSDVDGNSGVETVTLSVGQGALNVTAGDSGAIVSNSGTSSVTINGTLTQLNALLASGGTSTLSFTGSLGGNTLLTLSINDNGNTGTGVTLPGSDTATIAVAPRITSSAAGLPVTATTMTIDGFGFDPIAANNSVSFVGGATGSVTSATATQLTVTSLSGLVVGDLNASVTTNGVSSGVAVQVASVTPVVTLNTANLAANATTVLINGFGFDTTPGNNSVVFNNGATGTVTAATYNQLTVTSVSGLVAGSLTANVTTNGKSSGAVQVATVTPFVTSSTAHLAATANTVTIAGFGFSSTAGNNTVAFNDGAVGTVTTASLTSLTVTFSTKPTSAGSLTAIVTSNSQSSGSATQIATVTPVITSSSANLAANAATITINGFGFDATAGNNSVAFNDGAVGSVTTASPTSLLVTFSTKPTSAGSLTAIVTSNSVQNEVGGVVTAVQVATVTPVVTLSTAQIQTTDNTVTINGFGFASSNANNSVVFNLGATGSVTTSSPTQIIVTFGTHPTTGTLTAIVTSNGASSGAAVQVATVVALSITPSAADLAQNAPQIIIHGTGFSTTLSEDSVVFDNGAVGNVTAATPTQLTVTFTSQPTGLGALNATVTVTGVGTSGPTQVANIVAAPTVTTNAADLPINAATITIGGTGFSTTPANNTVVFNVGAAGNVTASTATSLTVTFTTQPSSVGTLTAIVTSNGGSSGAAVQVARVVPVVTMSTANLAANATSIIIAGFGFDPIAGNNTVTFNDGAVGTVTNATANSLTLTFSTNPTSAGSLTASVTTDTIPSGAAVQVATVTPVVTTNATNLAANAATIVINGFGFDSSPGNNFVAFNLGAVGNVTAASATQLTVTFTTPPTAGNLTAVVTSNAIGSGAPVQVATVTPVVTMNTASLAANAASIVISGFGFDATPANNSVVFNDGAVGNVTAASATSLTVTFTTNPTSAGSLTAIVTTNSVSSGAAVQVATVTPVVTMNTANLAANAASIIIAGFGFDPTPANNSVVFNDGAVGSVTAASPTSLTVTFSTKPTSAGSLTAIATSNSQSSGAAVQVATVTPVVTLNTANLAANAASIVINGFGFDPTPANNSVVFNDGAVGSVTAASPTSLTVTFSTKPTSAGSLTTIVNSNGQSSGAAVQVAAVIPVVTMNTASLAANAASIVISGFGFDATPANNSVVFNDGAIGSVTAASPTSLTVTFSTKPASAGSLTAVVTTNGNSSGAAVQVATVTPVVMSSAANLAANAVSFVINGFGFDPTPANNSVAFSGGVTGTVTAASPTQLTVSSLTGLIAGVLNASVTSNGQSSGAAVQVATVTPVVTPSTANLATTSTSMVINGFGFSPTPANNTVSFSGGVTGTVTSATSTQLTISSLTGLTLGSLNASVTSNGQSSGAAVQVANVVLVTLPVFDPFTQANGSDLGYLWIQQTGAYHIASNQANGDAGLNLASITNVNAANTVIQADVTLAPGNTQVGLVARYSGSGDTAANMYWGMLFRIGANTYAWIMRHDANGSWTLLNPATANNAVTVHAGGDKLRFEVIDSSLQLFLNGTLVASATDSVLTTGSVGMRSLLNNKLDNFSGKAVFTDTFTQPNGTGLNGAAWTTQAGTFTASNNNMVSGPAVNLATVTGLSEADVGVEANTTLVSGGLIGLVARHTSADYYTGVLVDSGGITYAAIYRHSASGFTQLSSVVAVPGNPKTGKLRFEVKGISLKLFMNGVQIVATTDAALTTGSAGMLSVGGGTFDNFRETPLS